MKLIPLKLWNNARNTYTVHRGEGAWNTEEEPEEYNVKLI